jgi:hypothetical protein
VARDHDRRARILLVAQHDHRALTRMIRQA